MGVIPFAVSVASVRLEHGYDQSGVARAVVPVLSPRPPRSTHPPESAMLAVPPESAVLPMAAAVTPPKTDPHQWQHAILQS